MDKMEIDCPTESLAVYTNSSRQFGMVNLPISDGNVWWKGKVTTLTEETSPELNSDYSKNEENKKAEKKYIAKHLHAQTSS